MNAPRKPRRPSETQKRPAYLEELNAYFEGWQLAPPHMGTPLAKAWTKGWHRGEDYHSDLSEELRDELREDKDLRAELKAEIEEDLNGE
jgi:hypothetical protein